MGQQERVGTDENISLDDLELPNAVLLFMSVYGFFLFLACFTKWVLVAAAV
jgi:hypothetical protein